MATIHLVFGGTLLLMFSVNLFTLPGSESASFFDRIGEIQPATTVKKVIGQFLPPRDQPVEQSPTTEKTASGPSGFLNRVIGQFIPHEQSDLKPEQKNTTSTTTNSTTTSTVPKSSAAPESNITNEGTKTTTDEGGSATVPPFMEMCYLVKNDSGIIKTVNMSRAVAGNDTYRDYDEFCQEDDLSTRISAGALASLAGKNVSAEDIDMTTMPPENSYCYLQKNDTGVIYTIYMSRNEAGNDTYPDYEEICDDEDTAPVEFSISLGALASLAG